LLLDKPVEAFPWLVEIDDWISLIISLIIFIIILPFVVKDAVRKRHLKTWLVGWLAKSADGDQTHFYAALLYVFP